MRPPLQDRNSHLGLLELHLVRRVWEMMETEPKTRRSEQEFLELEMIQAAYFSSQKGKKYLPQISGTQSKSPFPPFCPKIKFKKLKGINLHLIILLAAQLCLTRFNTMDCSLLGSTVHGILQAIILEWVAISFSTTKYQQTEFISILKGSYTMVKLNLFVGCKDSSTPHINQCVAQHQLKEG